ncbi:MAG: hypothetical protein P4L10_06690 [Acidobacteriaceae bacterium]|nr:hypothetical protein [Acidobacteriaceae bacterium]
MQRKLFDGMGDVGSVGILRLRLRMTLLRVVVVGRGRMCMQVPPLRIARGRDASVGMTAVEGEGDGEMGGGVAAARRYPTHRKVRDEWGTRH